MTVTVFHKKTKLFLFSTDSGSDGDFKNGCQRCQSIEKRFSSKADNANGCHKAETECNVKTRQTDRHTYIDKQMQRQMPT